MSIRRTGLVPRPQFVRDARIFVIAVEGEKTEAQYFSLFESTRIHVEVLPTGPEGRSAPKHVLERLVKFEEQFDLDKEDEKWLVVDVDRQRGQFLEEVTQVAQESGYGLAVSNPCFELWLLLHFQDVDLADTDCGAVIERLRPHVGGYRKAKSRLKRTRPTEFVRRSCGQRHWKESGKRAGRFSLEHTFSRSWKDCSDFIGPDQL